MKTASRRRLIVEFLEARLPMDAAGMGPQEAPWERVVVSFHDDVADPRAAAQEVLGPLNGRLGHVYEHALRGFSAELPAPALAGLARNPLIERVEADLVMQAFAQSLPTGIDRIDAELNRTGGLIGSGKQIDVDIAIIDTGIALHEDLNVVDGRRFYYQNSGPPRLRGPVQDDLWADDNGHGTHVAGIAAAKDDNQGIVGVAPGARLWAVKVLDANGSGYMGDIIEGIDWVTERASQIEVANMSLGGVGSSELLRAAIQNSVAQGIVYVAAAGNDWADIHGPDLTFNTTDDTIPAAYPEVATISAFADSDGRPGGLGVPTSWGSYGMDDQRWWPSNLSNGDDGVQNAEFLNANPVDSPGLGIDLTLPGVDITSTWLGGGYQTLSGTSMAAPHAAGLAALHIAKSGRATDAAGVFAIRQALIDGGRAWDSAEGLLTDGPDRHEENLGWADTAPAVLAPAVTITSVTSDAGAASEVVRGSVTVTATADPLGDAVSVNEVKLYVNEQVVDTASPPDNLDGNWTLSWNTLDGIAYPDGDYTLTVQATDNLGQIGSATLDVTVDNVDDLPTVAILSPASGSTLSGAVTLVAEAADDSRVTAVEFFLDPQATEGVSVSLGSAQPAGDGTWALAWDAITDGSYLLRAVVTDDGGQMVETSVQITVDNSVATLHAVLNGAATQVNRNFWRATATVTVRDSAETTQPGAVVTGSWIETGAVVVGTTDAHGQISFTSDNIRSGSSIQFRVENLELARFEFEGTSTITITESGSTTGSAAGLPAPGYERVDAAGSADDTRESDSFAASVDQLMAEEELRFVAARRAPIAPAPAVSFRPSREGVATSGGFDSGDLDDLLLTSELL